MKHFRKYLLFLFMVSMALARPVEHYGRQVSPEKTQVLQDFMHQFMLWVVLHYQAINAWFVRLYS